MKLATKIFLWVLVLCVSALGVFAQDLPAAKQGTVQDALAAGQPLLEPQDKAAIIHLDAEVDDMMLHSLKRRVDIAERAGCRVIIFEIDTYGGAVTSGIEISQFIKELADKKIITVAWIHHKAISAGAMITVACQHVVMSTEAVYGDCAPIAVASTWTGGNQLVPLPPTERAKFESPVVAEFEDSAAKNHWDRTLLDAMVVVDVQVHEIRNKATGEVKYVGTKEKDDYLAKVDDGPGGAKLHNWEYVETVKDNTRLLTLTTDMAVKMKLAQGIADDVPQLKALLNIRGEAIPLEFSWAELATVFLTQTEVRFFLFLGMLIFGWLEFSHPGTFIFGSAALICLVLLIGAPFLTGLAQVWEIALIVVGVAIIIADILAFGGVGMLAVPGFVLMAIGLVASFIPSNPGGGIMHSQQAWGAAERGLGVIVGGTFLSLGIFYCMAKYLHVMPGFKRLQLAPAGGMAPGAMMAVRDAADREASEAVFVGAIGRAASGLRPAGKARFGEHLVDVVSGYGSFIEAGTDVEVIEVKGTRVVVKPLAAASQAT